MVRTARMVLAASMLAVGGAAEAGPAIVYSTYLGGSGFENAVAVASDAEGNAYVVGNTSSADFPGAAGPKGGRFDVFVTKLDRSGRLVWSVSLGGSAEDWPGAIAADSAGNVLVAGTTLSTDFPVRNAFQALHGGGRDDAFVTKLGPDGDILWSTYLGGSEREWGEAVAVGAQGDVYVVGTTYSPDFPQVQPLPLSPDTEPGDAFVTRLRADGSALVSSTRLGGRSFDFGEGVAVDPAGHIYVAGQSSSDDFPLLNEVHTPSFVSDEGFLTKLSPSGDSLVYSTFLSGSYSESALAVAADPADYAYVTGYTASVDFFTLNPIQGYLNADEEGTTDLFIARLDPSGNFVYSTYFGGFWSDQGVGIAAGPDGSAWVAGLTSKLDYPQHDPVPGACGPCGGRSDAVLTRLAPDGSAVVFSTLIGGSDQDDAHAIALTPDGSAVLTGYTSSEDFPVVAAFQPAFAGLSDAFVFKLSDNQPPDCSAAGARPSVIWPPNGQMVPVSILGVTDPDGDPSTLKITGITQDEPGAAFSGIGSSVAQVKAERDGKGDGRVYRIQLEATDPSGVSCTGEVRVHVPHDQGKG